jgi:ketohexokinase
MRMAPGAAVHIRSAISSRSYVVADRVVPHESTVGAGDTFVSGVLFGLISRAGQWDAQRTLKFAVELATSKVQQEGFQGLGSGLAV